jgi:hypothetical protein
MKTINTPPKFESIRKRLNAALNNQRKLLDDIGNAAQGPDARAAEIDRLQRDLRRLTAQVTRLTTELQLAQRGSTETVNRMEAGFTSQQPIREQVLDLLDEIGVPASPRAISEVAWAVYGRHLPADRFASLRRDEWRSFKNDSLARPAWIVPAINVLGLNAIPRIVASSAWEMERRLIGTRTLRTNHLKTLLALLRSKRNLAVHSVSGTEKDLIPIVMLIARYAETVPGALEPGKLPDDDRISKAAEAELTRMEEADLAERHRAASELVKHSKNYQLWGRLGLIEGNATSRAGTR